MSKWIIAKYYCGSGVLPRFQSTRRGISRRGTAPTAIAILSQQHSNPQQSPNASISSPIGKKIAIHNLCPSFISFVADRNEDQQQVVAAIFSSAWKLNQELVCNQVVLIEFVYILDKIYNVAKADSDFGDAVLA